MTVRMISTLPAASLEHTTNHNAYTRDVPGEVFSQPPTHNEATHEASRGSHEDDECCRVEKPGTDEFNDSSSIARSNTDSNSSRLSDRDGSAPQQRNSATVDIDGEAVSRSSSRWASSRQVQSTTVEATASAATPSTARNLQREAEIDTSQFEKVCKAVRRFTGPPVAFIVTAIGLITIWLTFQSNKEAAAQTDYAAWSALLAFRQDCQAQIAGQPSNAQSKRSVQDCADALEMKMPPPPIPKSRWAAMFHGSSERRLYAFGPDRSPGQHIRTDLEGWSKLLDPSMPSLRSNSGTCDLLHLEEDFRCEEISGQLEISFDSTRTLSTDDLAIERWCSVLCDSTVWPRFIVTYDRASNTSGSVHDCSERCTSIDGSGIRRQGDQAIMYAASPRQSVSFKEVCAWAHLLLFVGLVALVLRSKRRQASSEGSGKFSKTRSAGQASREEEKKRR